MKTHAVRCKRHSRNSRRRDTQRAFSLIEVMVGLAVSLIGTFAMMQAFAMFEGQKRSTASGDDAQQAGSFALYQLERQVRTGGSAIIQGRSSTYQTWGCAIKGIPLVPTGLAAQFPSLPNTAVAPDIRAFPALIYSGGATGSDEIVVVSGNPAIRTFGAGIYSVAGTQITMGDSAFGFASGEYLLGGNLSGVGTCVLGKISAVSDPTPPPLPPNNPTNRLTLTGPLPTVPQFTSPTYLFDLGPNPVMSAFAVNTTQSTLQEYDLLQRNGVGPGEIADGIILMKALYGVDDGVGGVADDGIVDEWVPASGTAWSYAALTNGSAVAANSIAQIKALRIAVVARSQLAERQSDYNGPTSMVLFPDLAAALSVNVTTDPAYRYKIYDVKIPLHNAAVNRIY